MASSEIRGYRHVFTWADGGALASPGFQTVVSARFIEDLGHRRAVESLVEHFDATVHPVGSRVRQLVSIEGIRGACALTVFLPLGACGDGRDGNYLAETVITSARWLEAASWDADAAFPLLGLQGESWLSKLKGQVVIHSDESLRRMSPGPLHDRLGELASTLNEPVFIALVAALAEGGEERIFLRESQESTPGLLDRLVLQLPLTLPPPLRARGRGEVLHPIAVRGRGVLHDEPTVRVQGLIAASKAEIPAGVFIFDLDGSEEVPRVHNRRALDYAHWLWERIGSGDWERVAQHYRQTVEKPGRDPLADLPVASTLFGADPEPEAENQVVSAEDHVPISPLDIPTEDPSNVPATLRLQREGWQQRRILEHEGWKVTQELEDQTRQLINTLRKQLEASQQEALNTIKGLQEKAARQLQTAQEALRLENETANNLLASTQQAFEEQRRWQQEQSVRLQNILATERRNIEKERENLQQFFSKAQRAIEQQRESFREEYSEYYQRHQQADQISGVQPKPAPLHGKRKPLSGRRIQQDSTPLVDSWGESETDLVVEPDRNESNSMYGTRRSRDFTDNLRDAWNRFVGNRRLARGTLAVIVIALLGLTLWYFELWPKPSPTPSPNPVNPVPPVTEVLPLADVMIALKHPGASVWLLEKCRSESAGRDALKGYCDAAQFGLEVKNLKLGKNGSAALLQSELNRRLRRLEEDGKLEDGAEYIGVDGLWGKGSAGALEKVLQETEECDRPDSVDLKRERNITDPGKCLVGDLLKLGTSGGEACDIKWPLQIMCTPSTDKLTPLRNMISGVRKEVRENFRAIGECLTREKKEDRDWCTTYTSIVSTTHKELEAYLNPPLTSDETTEAGEAEADILFNLAARTWDFQGTTDPTYAHFVNDLQNWLTPAE